MRFEAPLSFAVKGKPMTKRLIAYVVDPFKDIRSVAGLSKEVGISTTSIFRIISCLFIPRKDCLASFVWMSLRARVLGANTK